MAILEEEQVGEAVELMDATAVDTTVVTTETGVETSGVVLPETETAVAVPMDTEVEATAVVVPTETTASIEDGGMEIDINNQISVGVAEVVAEDVNTQLR